MRPRSLPMVGRRSSEPCSLSSGSTAFSATTPKRPTPPANDLACGINMFGTPKIKRVGCHPRCRSAESFQKESGSRAACAQTCATSAASAFTAWRKWLRGQTSELQPQPGPLVKLPLRALRREGWQQGLRSDYRRAWSASVDRFCRGEWCREGLAAQVRKAVPGSAKPSARPAAMASAPKLCAGGSPGHRSMPGRVHPSRPASDSCAWWGAV